MRSRRPTLFSSAEIKPAEISTLLVLVLICVLSYRATRRARTIVNSISSADFIQPITVEDSVTLIISPERHRGAHYESTLLGPSRWLPLA
eukprot:31365-Pelagococcus_subviridis.AAC.22